VAPGGSGPGSGQGPVRIRSAVVAYWGTTPLPNAVNCWTGVNPRPGSVTQPGSNPINHSTNRGDGGGRLPGVQIAGSGAGRAVMCSQ
jgi:hypothetical protein